MNKENNHNQTRSKAITSETSGYCLQMGSKYCKNECPNQCYGRFQDLIDKLFENAMEINTDARECP